jgi:hypothetical protein
MQVFLNVRINHINFLRDVNLNVLGPQTYAAK